MNPLRWDVLLVAFVLALPVLMLGLRGDFTPEEVTVRLPWCLAAGWGVVAVLRFAATPRTPVKSRAAVPHGPGGTVEGEQPEPTEDDSPA
jgi:hypothetical protein